MSWLWSSKQDDTQPQQPEAVEEPFSISKCKEQLSKIKKNGDDTEWTSFCDALWELAKVFDLLGTGFGFVKSDITGKIGILRNEINGKVHGESFETLEAMITLELKHHGKLEHGKPSPRGTRTLLRLSWVLNFILTFLDIIAKNPQDQSLYNPASHAYQQALSPYHPWAVRQLVSVALYALPTQPVFLEKLGVAVHSPNADQVIQKEISEFVDLIRPHVARLKEVYESHKLSLENLP
eukprot:TRINITY_DN2685_c0_g1_i1.p1 TRINITY_DN2685_c0_g1~~TRINITY_DN2685_c0_g1_i1.p1  ORF type:complete len:237 (-),score=62.05 TRINITY_DN2685_c0_g1_i1:264-974(-)